MSLESDFLEAFEIHSPKSIRKCLDKGASPTALIKGKRPIDILIEMYSRSANFAPCLRVLLDAGATIGHPLLEAILLDDPAALQSILTTTPAAIHQSITIATAYTATRGVTPLHICAEFNSIRCAHVLLDAGADVNAPAATDENGLNGHTPIFHTVNTNHNYCRPMMELLADRGADLTLRLKGIVWGENLEWETVLFDVTPVSYAQCGLYRQFHRDEAHIYSNLDYLYRKLHNTAVPSRNVPNRYLAG
ncbi:MAG: hypothetical protein U0R19_19510 [Bryobacteraceae bacterium]